LDLQHSKLSGQQASFKILIVGEIGSGKTKLTEKLVNTLIRLGLDKMITVIDFAPSYRGIGLPLNVHGIRILKPKKIYAPRLMGKSCDEVWEYARRNAKLTEPLIKEYIERPTPILVINDLTLYLHAGDPKLLYKAIDLSTLFIGNAYYGLKLKDECSLWQRERELVEELFRKVDVVWRL